MKFGLWTVLHRDKEATRYICQCECGTVKSVDKYLLKNGKSWHCGCQTEKVRKQAAEKYSEKFRAGEYEQKPADIIGRQYGKLQVLSKVGDDVASRSSYVSQCDCGNKVVVKFQNLVNSKGRWSCGCAEFTDLTGKRYGRLVAQERVTAAIKSNCYHSRKMKRIYGIGTKPQQVNNNILNEITFGTTVQY